ncbi:hypothetical protein GCM10022396_09130 [Flavivirga amylovorans]
MAQTITENYVKATAYQVKTLDGLTSADTQTALADDDRIETVQYFDGLGRPMQSVAVRGGGLSEDIITHIDYDPFGRQDKEYLPYAISSNGGLYRTGALVATTSFYNTTKYENTLNPYSEKHLEASPLNRVLEQGAPGEDWAVNKNSDSDHTIKFGYLTNADSDYVKCYSVSFPTGDTEAPQLVDNGVYPENQLYKTVTKDENWQPNQQYPNDHTTEGYKDKLGRIILERTFNINRWYDTYYVYDDFGNLTYVLPPKLFTYQQISQPYLGTNLFNDYSGNVSFFDNGDVWNEVALSVTANGELNLYIYAEDYPLGTPFKSGKIADSNLPPELPDMTIGNIMVEDVNGNSVVGATAYIQGGDLYFTSTNIGIYDGYSGYGELDTTVQVPLSNYQSVYVPPSLDLSALLDDLAYQYRYDNRNRLVEKKIPGKDWEYIVYNKLDQSIMTQDANLRVNNEWLFTKYDAFGRVAFTGLHIHPGTVSRATMQNSANDTNTYTQFVERTTSQTIAGTTIYYTNTAIPHGVAEIYTINYYDDYGFDKDGLTIPSTGTDGKPVVNHNNTEPLRTKGLATGSKVKVLDTNDWITTITGYDNKGQVVYSASKNNYLGTTDIVENELNFVGKVKKSTATHSKTGHSTLTIEDDFDYDHMNRLIAQKQNINNQGEELIAKNHYDELGQLIKKDVGNTETQPLQEVDYAYNVRGWLKSINDPINATQGNDLFSFGLNYNKPEYPSTNSVLNLSLFNGNISHTYWRTNNESNDLKHYTYRYDALNRFVSAYYGENNSFSSKYGSFISKYDRNGNILNLLRNMPHPSISNSGTVMDNLAYTYDGNQLLTVNEGYINTDTNEGFKDGNTVGDDYRYDANGNMVMDLNKGIGNTVTNGVAYNHLNLPTSVSINSGGNVGTISYIYDATGVKLEKKVVENGNPNKYTFYASNYVYDRIGDSGNGSLKFFNHQEGYVDAENGYEYVYQYRDHLGNIRLSYKDSDNSGTIIGENNYVTVFSDGFESASGWDGTGHTWGWDVDEFDSNFKFQGNYAARLDPHPTVHHENVAHSNEWVQINNTATTDYIYSCWAYLENVSGNNADFYLFMNEPGETGYYTLLDSQTTYTKEKWVYLEKTVSVPSNITQLNIRIDNDHAGKVWFDDVKIARVDPTNNSEILEENNYYPFGLKHKGYNNVVNSTNPALKYKYNGKELEEALDYDMYEYEARHYDAALGRFVTVDPLAEDYSFQSPYAYAVNNPIFFIDKLGMGPDWIDNGDGTYTAEKGDSAWTLYTQHLKKWGYTKEEVNEIVVNQQGANFIGEDGEEKSNVHPEVTSIANPKEVAIKEESEKQAIGFIEKAEKTMESNYEEIAKLEHEIDSIEQVKEDKALVESSKNAVPGDPSRNGRGLKSIKKMFYYFGQHKQTKRIEERKKSIESRRKDNERKREFIDGMMEHVRK